MRIRLILMIAFGLLSTLALGQAPSHPVPGQMAPDVYAAALRDAPEWMEPGEISLERLRGKVVYLKFWTTGCLPCVQAIPKHNELKKKFGDKLVFLGVTPQTLEEVEDFLAKHETSMVVLSDPEYTTWFRYYPPGLGSGTLICPDGRVSRLSVSDLALDEAMIEMAMRNEYEDGPPIDMHGEILPHARALGSEWGKPRGERDPLFGQDPYSLAQKASFQIICRPSWDNGKFVGGGTRVSYTWLSSPALWIIKRNIEAGGFLASGFSVPEHRIIGPDWLSERYFDFVYTLPGVDELQRQQIIETALAHGMGVTFARQKREMDGYRMRWSDTSKRPPQSDREYSQWLGGQKLDNGQTGTIVRKYTLAQLAKKLEELKGVPIVSDEDRIAYDFELPPIHTSSIDAIALHMLQRYGLRLEPEKLEVEVLVVRERQTIGD